MKLSKMEKSFFDREFSKNAYLKKQYALYGGDSIASGSHVKVLYYYKEKLDFYFEIAVIGQERPESCAYIQCGKDKGKEFFHITFLDQKSIKKMLLFAEEYRQNAAEKEYEDERQESIR